MELEVEMSEAEEWETLVQQLYEGLECADKNLTTRLEHDLNADDFPEETKVKLLACKLTQSSCEFFERRPSYWIGAHFIDAFAE